MLEEHAEVATADAMGAITALGVATPRNPSPEDLKVILDAYVKQKSLDAQVLTTYLKSCSVSLKTYLDGLIQFSKDITQVSLSVSNNINVAIKILEKDLDREDITLEERERDKDRIIELIKECRQEAKEQRGFVTKVVVAGGLVVVGIAFFVISKGKDKQTLEKGLELARRAFT